MTTQLEQPTQTWLAGTVAAVRDAQTVPRPVTTGEMLRRFGTEEVLTGSHGSVAHPAPPRLAAAGTPWGHHARRSSFLRLRRERVLMVLATLTLGLTMTGLAYVTVLFL